MSTVVALGDPRTTAVLALAGVRCVAATTADEALAAWRSLDRNVGLVVLSPAAFRSLEDELATRPEVLTVVMPS